MSEYYFNEKEETMPRAQLEELQNERLKETVKHAFNNNEFFRKYLGDAGINPDSFSGLSDLARLPFSKKSTFREQYPDKMCCIPREEIREMHMSSGTSGTPVMMFYNEHDLEQWAICMARCLRMAGVQKSDVFQITPGLGLFNGGFGCYHGGRKAECFVIPAGPGNTPRQLKLMQDLRTNAFLCVVSYGTRILEVMQQQNITLPDLKVGIFGAEPFPESTKQKLREGFGIDVFDIYGMTETGGIGTLGQDCKYHNGIHVWEDQYICEIVDTKTGLPVPDGETGELVITSLNRQAIPIIRYRTGDLTHIISRGTCECGRTHLRISPVTGRVDDMIIVKGVNIFPSQIEHSLMKIPGVHGEYQILIDEVDGVKKLYVKVEAEPSVTGYTVSRQLKEDLGFAVDGEVVPVGTLPRSDGKAKRVIYLNKEGK